MYIMKTLKNFDDYINNLKKPTKKCPRKTMKNCFQPKSKSAQTIKICDKYVYKTPKKESENDFYYGKKYIQMDPNTINLLTQSIFFYLKKHKYLKENERVEHYESICKMNQNYSLQSLKMKWEQYVSLEEYILNSDKIKISCIEKWLKQVFHVLDKLYEMMQFHHCDPKAAQILLNKDGNAILADLDKVTYTINVNNEPKRIFIESQLYKKLFKYIKIKNESLSMRWEKYPRKNNDYEKACFMSSIIMLCDDEYIVSKLYKLSEKLLKNNMYYILPKKSMKLKSKESLTYATQHIQLKPNKTIEKEKQLKSIIHINDSRIHVK